jgi:subtilisin family serine protease
MQFMLAPYPIDGDPFADGRPELGAHVTNNSWGCPEVEGCDPFTLEAAVNALRSAGIFVVTSVGNDGYAGCETVSSPIALFEQSYSVGAISRDGSVAAFSSMGPVRADGSGRTKPDIAAPGVDILSAYPGRHAILPPLVHPWLDRMWRVLSP